MSPQLYRCRNKSPLKLPSSLRVHARLTSCGQHAATVKSSRQRLSPLALFQS